MCLGFKTFMETLTIAQYTYFVARTGPCPPDCTISFWIMLMTDFSLFLTLYIPIH